MQLRQRNAAIEDSRGQGPSRGAKRPGNKSRSSVVPSNIPASSGRSSRSAPDFVRYEKALNVTYIATGVTSPRNLRSGVNHQSAVLVSSSKSRNCKKHQNQPQQQPKSRKPKNKGFVNNKRAGTSRRDVPRNIGIKSFTKTKIPNHVE